MDLCQRRHVCFILEVLLLEVHMQVTLVVFHEDLKSNGHLDEAVLKLRLCLRLQVRHADNVVNLGVFIYLYMHAFF